MGFPGDSALDLHSDIRALLAGDSQSDSCGGWEFDFPADSYRDSKADLRHELQRDFRGDSHDDFDGALRVRTEASDFCLPRSPSSAPLSLRALAPRWPGRVRRTVRQGPPRPTRNLSSRRGSRGFGTPATALRAGIPERTGRALGGSIPVSGTVISLDMRLDSCLNGLVPAGRSAAGRTKGESSLR
jgi:hypothetical protein